MSRSSSLSCRAGFRWGQYCGPAAPSELDSEPKGLWGKRPDRRASPYGVSPALLLSELRTPALGREVCNFCFCLRLRHAQGALHPVCWCRHSQGGAVGSASVPAPAREWQTLRTGLGPDKQSCCQVLQLHSVLRANVHSALQACILSLVMCIQTACVSGALYLVAFFTIFFFFLWSYPWHMEVLGPGVKPAPQQ